MDIHIHTKETLPSFRITRVRNHKVCLDHDVLDLITTEGEVTLFLSAGGTEQLSEMLIETIKPIKPVQLTTDN